MNLKRVSLSGDEYLGLISNLATMLTAGISILEIVDSLLEDSKGNQKKILEEVRADLMQGNRLHFSFSKFPSTFDNVTVNIIKASEEAGTLEMTLKELKERIRKDIEFKDKLKSALTYPALIMVVFAGIMIMILTFVIPRISVVFSRMNVTLPLPTKILIFVSNIMMNQTIPLLIGTTLFTLTLVYFYKSQRKNLLNLLFKLPVLSDLITVIDLARFTNGLSMLLKAGIPITSALELTEDVVTKKDISKAIKHLKETVLSGKKISEGLKDSKKLIPSIMIKITEAGEKSGSLERAMQDVSEFLDYKVTKQLKTATTMMEPLIMVFVGVLIGGMMLAIIAPMYGLISQVGTR
jgi:type II secretory pathway component PulF